MKHSIQNLIIGLICLIMTSTGFANSSAKQGEFIYQANTIKHFSKKVERAMAENGARVAIISRVGRPDKEMPEGLRYTHVAIAVYSSIASSTGEKQPGYVIYNLYQKPDKLNESELIKDFPFDFYSSIYQLRSGIIIPKPKLQQKILKVLMSETYAKLHNPKYSAISNPFNSKYQNCTEHTMDVIQAALYDTAEPQRIKANLRHYFEPFKLPFSGLTIFMGSMFSNDIAVTDHQDGKYRTATFSSIKNYFEQYNLAENIIEIFASEML